MDRGYSKGGGRDSLARTPSAHDFPRRFAAVDIPGFSTWMSCLASKEGPPQRTFAEARAQSQS